MPKHKYQDQIHQQPSLFPRKMPNGRVVLDEVCLCGHLRSEHRDTIAYGHGSCACACMCERYPRADHVFAPGGKVRG